MGHIVDMMLESARATSARLRALDDAIAAETEVQQSDLRVMEEIRRKRTKNANIILRMVEIVSSETGIDPVAIVSTSAKRSTVRARQLVMYMAHRQGVPLEAIAEAFKRDHTTVAYGVKSEKRRRGEG